ncbi:hypothetical protein J4466_03915 [Candidatus Pacearchaeota archaeon]|nr:hypothetical protein [Candidatus Pacearchaeota archaeon]
MVDVRRIRTRRVTNRTTSLRIVDEKVWKLFNLYYMGKVKGVSNITKSELIEKILRDFLKPKIDSGEFKTSHADLLTTFDD